MRNSFVPLNRNRRYINGPKWIRFYFTVTWRWAVNVVSGQIPRRRSKGWHWGPEGGHLEGPRPVGRERHDPGHVGGGIGSRWSAEDSCRERVSCRGLVGVIAQAYLYIETKRGEQLIIRPTCLRFACECTTVHGEKQSDHKQWLIDITLYWHITLCWQHFWHAGPVDHNILLQRFEISCGLEGPSDLCFGFDPACLAVPKWSPGLGGTLSFWVFLRVSSWTYSF